MVFKFDIGLFTTFYHSLINSSKHQVVQLWQPEKDPNDRHAEYYKRGMPTVTMVKLESYIAKGKRLIRGYKI